MVNKYSPLPLARGTVVLLSNLSEAMTVDVDADRLSCRTMLTSAPILCTVHQDIGTQNGEASGRFVPVPWSQMGKRRAHGGGKWTTVTTSSGTWKLEISFGIALGMAIS